MDQDRIEQPTDDQQMWTVDDVARYLQTTPNKVRQLKRSAGLPSHRISYKVVRFSPAEVRAWSRSRCSTAAPQPKVET